MRRILDFCDTIASHHSPLLASRAMLRYYFFNAAAVLWI